MERTYIMVKPDGVQRGLVGEIISRFEKKGFKLQALKLYTPSREVSKANLSPSSSWLFYLPLKSISVFNQMILFCCHVSFLRRTMLISHPRASSAD
jgi:nucleoside diphosphate kinase